MKNFIKSSMSISMITVLMCAFSNAQTTIVSNAGANKSTCCASPPPTYTLIGSGSCTGCIGTAPTEGWYSGNTTTPIASVGTGTTVMVTPLVYPAYYWHWYMSGTALSIAWDRMDITVVGPSCCRAANPNGGGEIESGKSITVVQIPGDNNLSIFVKEDQENSQVEIFDMQGRSVYSQVHSIRAGENLNINASIFEKGVYSISISNGNETMLTQKFIIQ